MRSRSARKRGRRPTDADDEQSDQARAQLQIDDPWGRRKQPCKHADHHRGTTKRKNCKDNPNCVYGLGELREGIWKKSCPLIQPCDDTQERRCERHREAALGPTASVSCINSQAAFTFAPHSPCSPCASFCFAVGRGTGRSSNVLTAPAAPVSAPAPAAVAAAEPAPVRLMLPIQVACTCLAACAILATRVTSTACCSACS